MLKDIASRYRLETNKEEAYLEYYEKHFSPLREQPLKLLEIGIREGGSLKMWRDYFPLGEISGLDIEPSDLIGPRLHIYQGDQTDKKLLKRLHQEQGPFDVIIDDGGHTMNQQISTFQVLYPLLKRGGMYFIEDLHTSYWGEFQDQPLRTTDYLKSLVDTLNQEAYTSPRCTLQPDYLNYQISEIYFYPSLCLVKK